MARVHPEIYFFGAGIAEGRADDARTARRQRRQPRRDGLAQAAGSARLHHFDPRLQTTFTTMGRIIPKAWRRGAEERSRRVEKALGTQVRRPRQSVAVLGPLRRPRLDARHDGHGAQPGADRRNRQGPGGRERQPALRLGFLSALLPDVRRRGAQAQAREQERSRPFEEIHRSQEEGARRHEDDVDLTVDDLRRNWSANSAN